MKLLMLNMYRILYGVTKDNRISIIVALVYITILNLIITYGFGMLAGGFLPVNIIHTLFVFPYIVLTAIGMLLIDIWIMMPLKFIKKEKKNPASYWGIIMYTGVCVLIFVYAKRFAG
jgi:hypothetical protein